MAELRENAVGLRQLLVTALEDQLIAPADELLHAQRGADLAQVLVPTAKKQDRFVAAVEIDGCFAHRLAPRGNTVAAAISHRHEKYKRRFTRPDRLATLRRSVVR